jgi:hypothetical protein
MWVPVAAIETKSQNVLKQRGSNKQPGDAWSLVPIFFKNGISKLYM